MISKILFTICKKYISLAPLILSTISSNIFCHTDLLLDVYLLECLIPRGEHREEVCSGQPGLQPGGAESLAED